MIKNIVFDFGNVLISLRIRQFRQRMIKHGIFKKTAVLDKILRDYEVGAIDDITFLRSVQKEAWFGSTLSLKRSWESMIGDFPVAKLELLKELKKEYNLYLLSNINQIHEHHIIGKLGYSFYQEFLGVFDKTYYSHHIGMRKPDPEIFAHVLKENTLRPEETLFIDDLAENTAAAKALGIYTWQLKKPNDLYQINAKIKEVNKALEIEKIK